MLQSGLWATEVDDHFFSIIKFDEDIICQIEASNNCRIPLPRWYVIGTKGTLMVKGSLEEFFDEAEINHINDDNKKEIKKIKLVNYPAFGFSDGFYTDFIKFLKGENKEFISMHESSKVMKILDLIRKSNKENRFMSFV